MKGKTTGWSTDWTESITDYPQDLRGQGNTYIKSPCCKPWKKNQQEDKEKGKKKRQGAPDFVSISGFI